MLIKLGDLIEKYNEKCDIPDLTVNDVHGININKQFFSPTIQIARNTSKYLTVSSMSFACNLMHVGRDGSIPIAYNNLKKDLIVSPAYFVFKNKRKDIILDEYLFLNFARQEFDRYATFCTDSSVRDGLSWDRFCEIELEVPTIEIQKKYVNIYKTLSKNIKVYESGLDDLKTIYISMFEDAHNQFSKAPLLDYTTERREFNRDGKLSNLNGVSQSGLISPNQKRSKESLKKTKIFYYNDIVYAPSSLKNGAVILNKQFDKALCSEEYIVLSVNDKFIPEFIFILLKRKELGRYIDFLSIDSVRNRFYYKDLEILDVPLVPIELQEKIILIYNVYLKRKSILEKLEEVLKDIRPILIKGAIQESKGVI